MTEKNCGNCSHAWTPPAPLEAPTAGAPKGPPPQMGCRRHPPQTHFIMVLRGNPLMGQQPRPVEEQRSAFPAVHATWLCGEWAPKLEVAA